MNNTTSASKANGDLEDNQWVGHLPMLLPHLEQGSLFEQLQINFDRTAQTPPWWEPAPAGLPLPSNYAAAVQTLLVFRCPTDNPMPIEFKPGSTNGTIVGIHFYNQGPFLRHSRMIENYDDGTGAEYPWRMARTNYLGVGGGGTGSSNYWKQWEGIYTNRSAITISRVTDGTSNTLLYGEAVGRADFDFAANQHWPDAVDISWIGGGSIPSISGLERGELAVWFQFSSNHHPGGQFCFADGTVRLFAYETSPYLILKMSGIRDNQIVEEQ